jgi:nicotinate-nucleotide adenylyltransferase
MRIGVLGGSFDPPHNGHLEMAQAAQESLDLDAIFFIPAFSQWQKHHSASPELRAHMVGLAIAGHSEWQLDLREIDRGSTTFTVETMGELHEQYPDDELFFILGADAAAGLDSWQESARLRTLCEFAIVTRPEYQVTVPDGFRFHVIDAATSNVSSTEIREWCATDDEESRDKLQRAVPTAVFNFLTSTNLYRNQ